MIRTQIQLYEEQSRRLHLAARQAGVSVAELIRRSVDRFLDEEARTFNNEKGRLTALDVCGRFRSGLSDVAIRHDDYLDEAYLPPAGS